MGVQIQWDLAPIKILWSGSWQPRLRLYFINFLCRVNQPTRGQLRYPVHHPQQYHSCLVPQHLQCTPLLYRGKFTVKMGDMLNSFNGMWRNLGELSVICEILEDDVGDDF